MEEIGLGVLPQGAAKTCFLSSVQRSLLATYPAPFSTIFETTDVKRFPHTYTGEKFPNFCAGVFHIPQTADFGTVDSRVFVIRVAGQMAQFPATGII